MKLVVATPLYPPEIGGPATYAALLERELPARGIEVRLVMYREVRHLPRILRHVAYAWRVYRAQKSADAALALDPVSTGLPTLIATRLARKKFLLKVVGDYAWEQGRARYGVAEDLDTFITMRSAPLPVRVLRWVERFVARRATRVIVPSEYLKTIVRAWGVPEKRIEVIYNAVSVETLGSVPAQVIALPRPLYVTAGRLVPWKHVDGVIDAMASLGDGSLVVVGDGPDRTTLEAHGVAKLGTRVCFTGALAHEDLLAVIKNADAFVLNSSYEGLSHVLVEAVLLGTPVVATRAGGNAEVIVPGTGVLVPVGDTAALAAALSDAGVVSGEADTRRFTIATMLEQTVELFRTL